MEVNDQARKDAMADAESLLLMARTHPMAWAWQELTYIAYAPQYAAEALHYGLDDPQDAAEYGRMAARCAFRAVPGLR